MLNVFIALPAEAKPLIKHWQLSLKQRKPFALYANSNQTLLLCVTGLGALNMAAACAYLEGAYLNRKAMSVNLGIAGGDKALGQLCMASKITCQIREKSWYPLILALPYVHYSPLLTLSKPRFNYSADDILDLEAAAFYQTQLKFRTKEFIHVIKIISDNPVSDGNNVTPALAEKLINQNMSDLTKVKAYLFHFFNQYNASPNISNELDKFLAHWHFTVTQKQQLADVLSQWQGNFPDESAFAKYKKAKSSKMVIKQMTQAVNEYYENYLY